MKRLRQYINMFINQRKKSRRTMSVITAFSGIAVFLLVYTLILPALALEEEAYCGLEVHQHSDQCYEQILTCDLNEHTHTEACYNEDGDVICGQQEHIHNDSCYRRVLSCGKEAHVHSSVCYIDPESKTAEQKTSKENAQNESEKSGKSGDSEKADAGDSSEKTLSGQATKAAGQTDSKEKDVVDVASEADEEKTLFCEGKDYSVSVSYGEEAGLPEDVRLEVRELTKDTADKEEKEEYENYYAQTQEAVYLEENAGVAHARFFDITFVSGQEEIEPAAPVSVKIEYQNAEKTEKNAEVTVIHFPEPEETELLEVEVTGEKGQVKELEFTVGSFSVYGIVYTVDFHYETDGEKNEFSIPGGSFVSLKDVVNTLGIVKDDAATEMDEIQAFVDVVENVEFSSPELVSISKVEEDATVGEIKDALGLVCEYSAELTEEEIAEMNAAEVKAGDWALISLKPFTSEESLTVTMKGGERFVVKVTDAKSYKFSFNVNNENAGYVHQSSSRYGVSITGGNVTDSGQSAWTVRPRSFAGVNKLANDGFRFVWWSYDGTNLYTTYRVDASVKESEKQIQPILDHEAIFTANFAPENEYYIMYDTEANGSLSGGHSFQTTNGLQLYSYSGDSIGVTATPTDNYSFIGWYDQEGNLVCDTKTFDLSKPTKDLIVTAKYRAPVMINYATKAFSGNNGGGTVSFIGANSYASTRSETIPLYTTPVGASAKANTGSKFLYWEDSAGNIVGYNLEFKPEGGQVKNETYYAVFTNQPGVIITINDHGLAKVSSSNTGNNDITNVRQNPGRDATYYLYDYSTNRVASSSTVSFVRWEIYYEGASTPEILTDVNFRYLQDRSYCGVTAIVKPKNTFIVNYASTPGGSINNTTDYAGSTTAKGATATANTGDGYHFLGWYIGERRVSTNEIIESTDLTTWKDAGYISADFTTITARFGDGYKITYQEEVDNDITELSKETITTGTPVGYTAPVKDSYNFVGWYNGNTLVTDEARLTSDDIGSVTSDMTFTAKYEKAYMAAYHVENVDGIIENGEVVSRYGEIALGSVRTYDSTIQTASNGGVLLKSATAVPVAGCTFEKWLVTDKSGNTITIPGFNTNNATIPANLPITQDVVFTAQFKKLDSSMEIVYNIQQDEDKHVYGAKLTVDGRTVSGTPSQSAYISEIVPENGTARGCSATGIVINGDQYDITGWVLGKDGESGKDRLFTLYSTFVPTGEFLNDIDGTGTRYFRVVPKWEQNVYVQTKVSIPEGGDFYLATQTKKTDDLIFINNRTRTTGENGGDPDNFRTEMARYNIKVNEGYKLVGYSFNGVELELAAPIMDTDYHSLTAANTLLKNPITLTSKVEKDDSGKYKTVTVNNVMDYGYHTAVFRNVDGTVERSLNILVANFEKIDSFNIQYHVKEGSGTVSNTSDTFTETEKETFLSKGIAPISGSTAIADVDNDYVFDHWEWDDETGAIDSETGESVRCTSTETQLIPDITKMSDPDKTYHYYAVFVQKPKVNIVYIPDNAEHGMTMPGNETVFLGDNASGAVATAFDGWKFSHWTRQDNDELVSNDPNFIPQVYNGEVREGDNIYERDFTTPASTVTFVAHFVEDNTGMITVHKTIGPLQNGLDKTKLEGLTIYFALTKDGKQQDYLMKEGDIWTESITLTSENIDNDGNVSAAATFPNLPDGNYEVWELADIAGNKVKQYVGMTVADGVQIAKISASNDSDAGGNNAILSGEDNQRNVYFTNTYSTPLETTTFEVNKEWQDSNSVELTGTSIPAGAQVEITVYQEVEGVTKAFRSIILDGTPDVDGEDTSWHALFKELPTKTDEGKDILYKVRETGEWPGYEPYINGGKTYLYENLYMTNSGGKIINRALETDEVLVTILKVDKNSGVSLAGATFELTKKNETGAYENYDTGIYAVSSDDLDKGAFTVSLENGQYRLKETIAPVGYVIVSNAFEFSITEGVLSGTENDYISFDSDTMIITVKNESGAELPATGGSGTKLFYTLGMILTAFAGIILLMRSKKTT